MNIRAATQAIGWKALALALAVGLVFAILNVGGPVEQTMQVARNKLRARPASGEIVLVAIDDRSVGELGAAPWHGARLAELLRRVDSGGPRMIHLDADFNQLGGRDDQARLERAIADARAEILLPAHFAVDELTGGRVDYRPPERFARHARLVNTNLRVYWDGAVWRHPYGARSGESVMPSLAFALAGSGAASEGLFPIDYAVDLRSIPLVSAGDLLAGRVPPQALSGRRVVIARTDRAADQYRAPGTGLFPGTVLHIVAAETLREGRPLDLGWLLPLALALAAGAAILSLRRRTFSAAVLAVAATAAIVGPVLLEASLVTVTVMPAIAVLVCAALARLAGDMRRAYRARGTTNIVTGMPNLQALQQAEAQGGIVVAARIRNYPQITATLPPALEKELVEQIVGRLEFGAGGSRTFQADQGVFVWVAEEVVEEELVLQLEGLQAVFRSPVVVGSRLIDVAVTFGLDRDADRPLPQRAASALVAADEAVRDGKRWAVFNPASVAEADWKMSLLGRLDHAIDHGELWVAYQPQFDCRTGELVGAEALVRWTHPERGQLFPDQFIAAAEQGGRIDALTWFVLDAALAAAARINCQGTHFTVAVNLSVLLLDNPALVPTVRALLRRHGLAAELLTLEVTETSTLGSGEGQIANLQRLANMGVQLSIDDYGTGFSTLEYLKRIPASELKIDRSFIGVLDKSQSDRIMVNSTIQLAHSLGRKVVAEGVENEEVLRELRRMRCDLVQGYHTGRPMPLAQLFDLIESRTETRAA